MWEWIFSFPFCSRIVGIDFFIPFPFPNFGNVFFIPFPFLIFGNGFFPFPSRSRTLRMELSIPVPVPVPELPKVIPAQPCSPTILITCIFFKMLPKQTISTSNQGIKAGVAKSHSTPCMAASKLHESRSSLNSKLNFHYRAPGGAINSFPQCSECCKMFSRFPFEPGLDLLQPCPNSGWINRPAFDERT